jgi:hypothetical protein
MQNTERHTSDTRHRRDRRDRALARGTNVDDDGMVAELTSLTHQRRLETARMISSSLAHFWHCFRQLTALTRHTQHVSALRIGAL